MSVEDAAEPAQPAKRRRVRVRIKTLEQQFDRWNGVKGKVYLQARDAYGRQAGLLSVRATYGWADHVERVCYDECYGVGLRGRRHSPSRQR